MFERMRAQSEFAVCIVAITAIATEVIKSERKTVLSYLKKTYGIDREVGWRC